LILEQRGSKVGGLCKLFDLSLGLLCIGVRFQPYLPAISETLRFCCHRTIVLIMHNTKIMSRCVIWKTWLDKDLPTEENLNSVCYAFFTTIGNLEFYYLDIRKKTINFFVKLQFPKRQLRQERPSSTLL